MSFSSSLVIDPNTKVQLDAGLLYYFMEHYRTNSIANGMLRIDSGALAPVSCASLQPPSSAAYSAFHFHRLRPVLFQGAPADQHLFLLIP